MNASEGVWLSINDYSRYKNVSISTIRRHIKNNILKHKEENGKYFIYVASTEKVRLREEEELLKAKLEVELLRNQLRELNEENAALKMLVELYESQPKTTAKNVNELPPEIPFTI
jgi:homoserine trans-succinylase